MRDANKSVLLSAAVLFASSVWIGPAAAQDASNSDGFASWGKASTGELEQQRAGSVGTATNNATVTGTQTLTASGSVNGGDINIAGSSAIETKMSITAINTGNNVVMQNTLAIVVNFD